MLFPCQVFYNGILICPCMDASVRISTVTPWLIFDGHRVSDVNFLVRSHLAT